MKTILISVVTLVLLPVWFFFAFVTARGSGSHMDGHSVSDFVIGLVAIAIPAGLAAAYYHFGWRFLWLSPTESVVLMALPAILSALAGGTMYRSLLPERRVPTKVHRMLQSQLTSVALAPDDSDHITGVPGEPVQVMEYEGRPPESTLRRSTNRISVHRAFVVPAIDGLPRIGFFKVEPRAAEAGTVEPQTTELWELDSAKYPRPTRRLKFVMTGPKRAHWHIAQVETLPNRRLLVRIRGFHQESLYVFDRDSMTLAPFSTVDVASQFELKPLAESAVIVAYESKRVRRRAEVYLNYYTHFAVFTEQYPDGIEVLTLGIDVGIADRWFVRDNTLHVQAHDPRCSDKSQAKWWSLDLSRVLRTVSGESRAG